MKASHPEENGGHRKQFFVKKPYVERRDVTEFARHGEYAGVWKQSLRDKSGEFVGCVSIAL